MKYILTFLGIASIPHVAVLTARLYADFQIDGLSMASCTGLFISIAGLLTWYFYTVQND